MKLNVKKIIKRVIIVVLVAYVTGMLFTILLLKKNNYFLGFNKDIISQDTVPRYKELFEKNYRQKLILEDSSSSRSNSYCNWYTYNSNKICILELNQYNNTEIKDIAIKQSAIVEKNNDFFKFSIRIVNKLYPYSVIDIYPRNEKAGSLNLFINSNIKKTIKTNSYLYIKFEGNLFEINSIKKYAELSVAIAESEAPTELLFFRKDNKTLIIIKFSSDMKNRNDISILNLISIK